MRKKIAVLMMLAASALPMMAHAEMVETDVAALDPVSDSTYYTILNPFEDEGLALLNYADSTRLAVPLNDGVTVSVVSMSHGMKFLGFKYWKDGFEDGAVTSAEPNLWLGSTSDNVSNHFYVKALFEKPDTAHFTLVNDFQEDGYAMLNNASGTRFDVIEGDTAVVSVYDVANGVYFVNYTYWDNADPATVNEETATSFYMIANEVSVNKEWTVKANFDFVHYTVTPMVAAACTDMGTVAVTHTDGSEITDENPVTVKDPLVLLTATANDGYAFAYWDQGNSSCTGNPLKARIESDTTLAAFFIQKLDFTPLEGDAENMFEMQTDGLCQGQPGSFNFNVAVGRADEYMVEFPYDGFTNVDWTKLDGNTFSFDVPADMHEGDFVAKVKFRSYEISAYGDTAKVESDYFYCPFHVNLPESTIKVVFDDVLAVDNAFGTFNTYQWYRNGILIDGATKGYYQEVGGLKGDEYYVRVNMKTLDEDRTCVFTAPNNASATKVMSVYPNPVSSNTTISLQGFDGTEHVMRVYNSYGVEVLSQRFAGSELKADFGMLPQGSYLIAVDGESVKVVRL